jgi:hypothetical protein
VPHPPLPNQPRFRHAGLQASGAHAGTFHFQKRQLFISDTLLQEDIALEGTANDIWSIYFYDVLLTRLDARDFRLYA